MLISSIIAHESLNLPCTFLTGLTWTHCESESSWVESESESESVRPESESAALESESTEVESESESTRVESESGLESGLGLGLTHWVRVRVRTRSNTASRGQLPLVQVFTKTITVSTYFDVFSCETCGSRTTLLSKLWKKWIIWKLTKIGNFDMHGNLIVNHVWQERVIGHFSLNVVMVIFRGYSGVDKEFSSSVATV